VTRVLVSGMSLLAAGSVWSQDLTPAAIPAGASAPAGDSAAPLIEPGDNALPAAIPPPISTPAETIAPAAEANAVPPPFQEDPPLPTEIPPVNTDSTQTAPDPSSTGTPEPIGPVSPLLTDSAPVTPSVPPIMTGGKRIQLSLDVEAVYDDNVFFSSTNPQQDYIFVASPKLTLQTGDFRAKEETYGILNYNPEAIYFAKGTGDDTLDQKLKTEVQYTIARLALGFEGSYQRLSGATPDLGDRVDRDEIDANIKLSYGWGSKFEAETNFLYTNTNYDPNQLADFSEFVNETFLRYQLTGRTKAALGVAFGRLDVDGFGAQTFQRALVQVMTDVGSKLTLRAKGGMEFRHLDYGDESTPVFSLALDYKLREGTTLALEAYREVSASGGEPGSNLTRTGIAAKLRQRLGTRFYGGLNVGYEQLAYAATERNSANASGARDDSYFFVRPSLQYELREGRRFELYYLHRENDSNVKDFSFEGNQLGASVGLDF
jgi:hypothetical protein